MREPGGSKEEEDEERETVRGARLGVKYVPFLSIFFLLLRAGHPLKTIPKLLSCVAHPSGDLPLFTSVATIILTTRSLLTPAASGVVLFIYARFNQR